MVWQIKINQYKRLAYISSCSCWSGSSIKLLSFYRGKKLAFNHRLVAFQGCSFIMPGAQWHRVNSARDSSCLEAIQLHLFCHCAARLTLSGQHKLRDPWTTGNRVTDLSSLHYILSGSSHNLNYMCFEWSVLSGLYSYPFTPWDNQGNHNQNSGPDLKSIKKQVFCSPLQTQARTFHENVQ